MKVVIVWFKQRKQNWVLELKFVVTHLYKIKCIYDIIYMVTYNQNLKVIHFEGWKKNQLHHSYKGDKKSSKIQM